MIQSASLVIACLPNPPLEYPPECESQRNFHPERLHFVEVMELEVDPEMTIFSYHTLQMIVSGVGGGPRLRQNVLSQALTLELGTCPWSRAPLQHQVAFEAIAVSWVTIVVHWVRAPLDFLDEEMESQLVKHLRIVMRRLQIVAKSIGTR